MAQVVEASDGERRTLNRQRVLEAAVEYADEYGVETLSMRRLGKSVGVEAMSLYNHVSSKDDLLDGIVELAAQEFEMPTGDPDWRVTVRRCALAAHRVLLRHPWMATLAESRAVAGPTRLAYYDALVGVFRANGFGLLGAHRANVTLDAYLYGFTLQETNWPSLDDEGQELADAFKERTPDDAYPNLIAIADLAASGHLDLTADFEAGLDAVLDGFGRLRDQA